MTETLKYLYIAANNQNKNVGKDIIWAFLFLLKVGQFVLAEWDLDMEYGLDYEEKEIIEALDNNTEICAVGHSSDPKCQAYRLAK